MTVVAKKTVKNKNGKPARRTSAATPEVETPVLFRLPDLSLFPELPPTAETAPLEFAATQLLVGPVSALEVIAPAQTPEPEPPKPTKPTLKNKLAGQSLALIHKWAVPTGRKVSFIARKASRLPYVGPAGLLCASLLITLGLIYTPWNRDAKPDAKKELTAANESAHAEEAEHQHNHEPARTTTEPKANLQLKKIVNQLDEQLIESESPDVSIAAATTSAPPMENEANDDGSFTEPWWRKKPTRDVQVAGNDADAEAATEHQVVHGDEDENGEPVIDEADLPAPKRTAMHRRQVEEPEVEREETRYQPTPRQKSNRYTEPEEPETREVERRSMAAAREAEDVESESEIPLNPWRRIRNERLERESPREEEAIAQKPTPRSQASQVTSKKPQYRSPPGQDIDLEGEWPTETATRPRGENKRNGVR